MVVRVKAADHSLFSTRLISKAVITGIRVMEKVRNLPIVGLKRSKKKRKIIEKRYLDGPSKSLQLNRSFPRLVRRMAANGKVNAIRINSNNLFFLKNSS
jgi:hypothetical protein